MSDWRPKNRLSALLFDIDGRVNDACFGAWQMLRRGWSAYDAALSRWRIRGPRRVIVDLCGDAATFGLMIAIGSLAYGLPAVSDSDDVWNRGREYSVTFTDASGTIIGRRGIWQDDAVPLDEIPGYVIAAVLATEDARFYDHFGVDVLGTIRAMLENMRANHVVQGGSSITQQVAKNLFLSPERSIRRKMREAFLALWIEARLSKNEILKLYLDRSYLGGGTYGVEAAAQFYFGKSIRDVTLAEAAMLAGLFKAPSNFAPHIDINAARARANVVLNRMLETGWVSQGQVFAARREPATLADRTGYYSPDWFLDWAYEETLRLIAEQRLDGEYVFEVKTTVDLGLQRLAQDIINTTLDEHGEAFNASQAALVAMTTDGAVKAIVGGRDYEESQFNRATEALRQPGSSWKPFVYLAALQAGFRPGSWVYDAPIRIGNWSPRNYSGRYHGRTTMIRALARSFNSVPVHLAQQIGRQRIIDVARRLGIKTPLRANASMPLGTNEVTVMGITGAYAGFASGGRLVEPYAVLEIARPTGEVLYSRARNAPRPRQVIDPELIAELNTMLHEVVVSGTGRRAYLGTMPQGGKTGTTQNYRDAWFIGFTGHFVTGVWFGNDDYTPMRRVTGGSLPAKTWHDFMSRAHETKLAVAIPGVPLDGRYAAVDPQLVSIETETRDSGGDELFGSGETFVGAGADGDEPLRRERAAGGGSVSRVFRNMFNLFSSDPPSARAPAAARRPAPARRDRGGWFSGGGDRGGSGGGGQDRRTSNSPFAPDRGFR